LFSFGKVIFKEFVGSPSQSWASAGGGKKSIFPLEIEIKDQKFVEILKSAA